jgi:hypothetical protein
MYFSSEDLKVIKREYLSVPSKFQNLSTAYVTRKYNDPRAHEYAVHGFLRRFKILARCINRIFDILPSTQAELPSADELSDVCINIQAFILIVFGSTDNLAWVWKIEKNLTKSNGSPIPNTRVGLRKKNTDVRISFSEEFHDYLKRLDVWFDHLENFRDALAHKIPIYIPPYMLPRDKEVSYRELENLAIEALGRLDFEEFKRLSSEQKSLVSFIPHMTHSFLEEAALVMFHPQILADFNTIEELGRKMLEELDR